MMAMASTAVGREAGRGLLTLANLITVVAPVAADWNDSHIFNQRPVEPSHPRPGRQPAGREDPVLTGYRQTRARFPKRLAWPPFPEPGGVLPLGRTDNGDELYWVTQGQPDQWPVALVEGRAALHELHPLPVTGFLAALAANQLTSRVLPDDLLGRPSHRFTPFPDR
jgi:hypothetical protein